MLLKVVQKEIPRATDGEPVVGGGSLPPPNHPAAHLPVRLFIHSTLPTMHSSSRVTAAAPAPPSPLSHISRHDRTPTTKQGCTAGTYKPAYGNQDGMCLPCPAGFFSEAIGATSLSDCEPCPLGFYGESIGASSAASCAECPAGTYGAVQGGGGALRVPTKKDFLTFLIWSGTVRRVGRPFHPPRTSCMRAILAFARLKHARAHPVLNTPVSRRYSDTYCRFRGHNLSGFFFSINLGIFSASLCTACWPGYYSESLGASSHATCIECPSNHSQPLFGASSQWDCVPCSDDQVCRRNTKTTKRSIVGSVTRTTWAILGLCVYTPRRALPGQADGRSGNKKGRTTQEGDGRSSRAIRTSWYPTKGPCNSRCARTRRWRHLPLGPSRTKNDPASSLCGCFSGEILVFVQGRFSF